jgi:site-specific DNA-methyltransferase (adenine-specific)
MLEIVDHFSLHGETVLDPFAGSGTTGVACNQLGRSFVGWEISPDYHAVAARRLAGDEARPNPNQPSLFAGLAG